MKNKKKELSTQDWLPIQKVLETGIICTKSSYVKVIKVYPINYDLKSNLEKDAILNSYKIFLKNCDFNFQILIQSKKENLTNHISKIKEKNKNEKENNNVKMLVNDYINFIHSLNLENKSSSKEFFIILKCNLDFVQKEFLEQRENIITSRLSEQYFKIKEYLSRCGNVVQELNNKKEVEEFLINFYTENKRKEE